MSLSKFLRWCFHPLFYICRTPESYQRGNRLRNFTHSLILFFLDLTLCQRLKNLHSISNSHPKGQNWCSQMVHLTEQGYHYKPFRNRGTNLTSSCPNKQACLPRRTTFPSHAFCFPSTILHSALRPDRRICLVHVSYRFSCFLRTCSLSRTLQLHIIIPASHVHFTIFLTFKVLTRRLLKLLYSYMSLLYSLLNLTLSYNHEGLYYYSVLTQRIFVNSKIYY